MRRWYLEARAMNAGLIARWLLSLAIVSSVCGVTYSYYRATYNHARRLRVVTEGKFYRSGQLTANGFKDAFQRFGIKCVINLQEEARDPLIPEAWRWTPSILESELCRAAGVKYISLDGGVLDVAPEDTGSRPKVLDEFIKLMHDENNFPVLIHCKAGLHRTGFLTGIYRMEFEGRSKEDVVRELRGNGFGTYGATEANDYVRVYIGNFQPSTKPGDKK